MAMIHTYGVEGMTCSNCAAAIKNELLKLPGVLSAEVNEGKKEATIEMQNHIPIAEVQRAVSRAGMKYRIMEKEQHPATMANKHEHAGTLPEVGAEENSKSWFATYKPIVLLFGIITLVSIAVNINGHQFHPMNVMRIFMAGFFLSFSFFKLLNLQGFADSYSSYDVIAKYWRGWGFVYAFIELALGVLYAVNFMPLYTNIATLLVMGISITGVLQSVINKRQIQCACLGTVFNLPMSTVTIIEDALMIVMSAVMLIALRS